MAMKKIIAGLAIVLSGCVQLPQEESDMAQATTSVDAVEGSTDQSTGLIDMMRRREDPQAGDPRQG